MPQALRLNRQADCSIWCSRLRYGTAHYIIAKYSRQATNTSLRTTRSSRCCGAQPGQHKALWLEDMHDIGRAAAKSTFGSMMRLTARTWCYRGCCTSKLCSITSLTRAQRCCHRKPCVGSSKAHAFEASGAQRQDEPDVIHGQPKSTGSCTHSCTVFPSSQTHLMLVEVPSGQYGTVSPCLI